MKPFSVKLTDEDLLLLQSKAGAAGLAPSAYARQLLIKALRCDEESAPTTVASPPATVDIAAIERQIRQAVWAIIVALHPEFDEDTALEFVREYLGRDAAAIGYRESTGA